MPAPWDSEALSLWGIFYFCSLIFDLFLLFYPRNLAERTTVDVKKTPYKFRHLTTGDRKLIFCALCLASWVFHLSSGPWKPATEN